MGDGSISSPKGAKQDSPGQRPGWDIQNPLSPEGARLQSHRKACSSRPGCYILRALRRRRGADFAPSGLGKMKGTCPRGVAPGYPVLPRWGGPKHAHSARAKPIGRPQDSRKFPLILGDHRFSRSKGTSVRLQLGCWPFGGRWDGVLPCRLESRRHGRHECLRYGVTRATPIGRPQDQRNDGRFCTGCWLPIDQRRLTTGDYEGGRCALHVAQVSKPTGPSAPSTVIPSREFPDRFSPLLFGDIPIGSCNVERR